MFGSYKVLKIFYFIFIYKENGFLIFGLSMKNMKENQI